MAACSAMLSAERISLGLHAHKWLVRLGIELKFDEGDRSESDAA